MELDVDDARDVAERFDLDFQRRILSHSMIPIWQGGIDIYGMELSILWAVGVGGHELGRNIGMASLTKSWIWKVADPELGRRERTCSAVLRHHLVTGAVELSVRFVLDSSLGLSFPVSDFDDGSCSGEPRDCARRFELLLVLS